MAGGMHGRGMHSRGVCLAGEACVAGRACMAGGMCGREHVWQRGSMCGRGHAWQGGHVWQILRDTVNEWVVHILLECILVDKVFCN